MIAAVASIAARAAAPSVGRAVAAKTGSQMIGQVAERATLPTAAYAAQRVEKRTSQQRARYGGNA